MLCAQDCRDIGKSFKQLGAATGGRVNCLEKIGFKFQITLIDIPANFESSNDCHQHAKKICKQDNFSDPQNVLQVLHMKI